MITKCSTSIFIDFSLTRGNFWLGHDLQPLYTEIKFVVVFINMRGLVQTFKNCFFFKFCVNVKMRNTIILWECITEIVIIFSHTFKKYSSHQGLNLKLKQKCFFCWAGNSTYYMRMAVNKPLQNFVYGANSFWRLSLTQHFLKAKQTPTLWNWNPKDP